VLSYFASKHKRLVIITSAIARRIARVAAAANTILEQQAKSKAKAVFIDAPSVPTYEGLISRIHLGFISPPPFVEDQRRAFQDAQLRVFWSRLAIHPIRDAECECGTTWLELFVLFSLRGGGNESMNEPAKEHLRATHADRFKRFQQASRELFRFADMASTPLTRPMLRGPSDIPHPLAPYGLLGKFAMLPFKLGLGEEVAMQ